MRLPPAVPVAPTEAQFFSRRTHNGSPTPQSSPGGFRHQHWGSGCIVDAMQVARHGGRDCPRFRRDVSRPAHVIAEGAIQMRQWTQVPSSEVNMVSQAMFPKLHRTSGLCTVRGVNASRGNQSRPQQQVAKTQRLRSHQRAMDSDSESEDEGHNVAKRLEGDEQPLQVTSHMDLVPSSPLGEVVESTMSRKKLETWFQKFFAGGWNDLRR